MQSQGFEFLKLDSAQAIAMSDQKDNRIGFNAGLDSPKSAKPWSLETDMRWTTIRRRSLLFTGLSLASRKCTRGAMMHCIFLSSPHKT